MHRIETAEGINWTHIIYRLRYGSLKFEDLEPAEQEEIKQIFESVIGWMTKFYNNLLEFVGKIK